MDFIIDCSVRAIGYHVYQAIWPNPYMGEPAVAVPGGIWQPSRYQCMPPVSVIRDDVIVGHLPRNISTPCHMFLRFGGTIVSCEWSETLFIFA